MVAGSGQCRRGRLLGGRLLEERRPGLAELDRTAWLRRLQRPGNGLGLVTEAGAKDVDTKNQEEPWRQWWEEEPLWSTWGPGTEQQKQDMDTTLSMGRRSGGTAADLLTRVLMTCDKCGEQFARQSNTCPVKDPKGERGWQSCKRCHEVSFNDGKG